MKRSAQAAAIAVGLFILVCAGAPTAAQAATVNVQTVQVLPPGGASCGSMPVQNIVPYLQNGELQSFDIVIADPSYVGIEASVGNTLVPFNYMSRWNNGDGTIKIHIDVDSTPIYGSLPVTVTFLSSPVGRPTCLTTVSFGILGNNGTAPSTGGTTNTAGQGTSHASGTTPIVRGSGTSSLTTAIASTSSSSPAIGSAVQSNLERACAASGSYQLWFVLLALFVVIVTIVAIAQPPLAERSPALPIATILIPLVLLIAFWYFAPLCRAASWIPVILIIAAILGLVVAFRDRGNGTRVIQLPPAKTK